MKKTLLLSAIALVVASTIGSTLQNQAENSPITESQSITESEPTLPLGLLILPTTKDLGTVIYGEVAETDFSLWNNTDQTVQITRVSTSCGCTKVFPEKETLAPNEKIEIQVTFDPAVHQDDSDLGEIIRTIYIETDHPELKRLESTITATVIKQ